MICKICEEDKRILIWCPSCEEFFCLDCFFYDYYDEEKDKQFNDYICANCHNEIEYEKYYQEEEYYEYDDDDY